MDLRYEILKEHSKQQSLKIAEWIGSSSKKFKELLRLFLYDEYRVAQRSSWVITCVAAKYPKLIEENIQAMVKRLYDENLPVAVKRNTIRVLQFIKIPKSLHARVMNICINYLMNPNETVAVKVFSMTVLAHLALQYPDIRQELEVIIRSQLKNSTAGFKARAKKVLKQLENPGNKIL